MRHRVTHAACTSHPADRKGSGAAEMLNESVVLSGAVQCVSSVSIFRGYMHVTHCF